MEDGLDADYDQIKDELFNAEDEVIISRYLKRVIVNASSLPQFIADVDDVFNKNPSELFDSHTSNFVVIRTEDCGKTDGCESGCWRLIGRDKLIKSEETGKILGFKRILKFCLKRKLPREYKRIWVMEEFRLTKNLNWNDDDYVICKIRFLFQAELSSLLAMHFSYLSTTRTVRVPANLLLPAYGFYSPDTQEDDESYCDAIIASEGNSWPSHVTNNVYRLHPLMLLDPLDQMFRRYGICIFTNETCGKTSKFDGGYWRILHCDRPIKSKSGKTIGFKKVFRLYETENKIYVREGNDVKKVTWTIEEYRFNEEVKQNKVLCVIKSHLE